MININLLDWRGKIRLINNNRFYALTGVAVVIVVICTLFVSFILNSMVDGEDGNVKYLSTEISAVEGKIGKIKDLQKQKDLLLSRRSVIETLQASSPFVVKVLDNLAKAVPEGVVLNSVIRTQDQLVITGSSDTNSQISTFMKNIAVLPWVKSYKLNDITSQTTKELKNAKDQKDQGASKIDFQLGLVLDQPNIGDEDEHK